MRGKNKTWRYTISLLASAGVSFGFILGLTTMPSVASAQYRAKDTEWPSYGADLAGTRYRPLDQINASNFSDLEIAWRIKTDNFGNRPEYKLEGTPLMVNDVLYATAGSRRAVIALDAATGELLGCMASMKERAAGPLHDNSRAAVWPIGQTEKKNEFSM